MSQARLTRIHYPNRVDQCSPGGRRDTPPKEYGSMKPRDVIPAPPTELPLVVETLPYSNRFDAHHLMRQAIGDEQHVAVGRYSENVAIVVGE